MLIIFYNAANIRIKNGISNFSCVIIYYNRVIFSAHQLCRNIYIMLNQDKDYNGVAPVGDDLTPKSIVFCSEEAIKDRYYCCKKF